jgi:circadian clock protein KaiB
VTSATGDEARYELTLFVSGASDLSARAIANARELCDTHLGGRYELSVLDIHEDATAALDSDVIAAPTLVRNRPLPVRKLVGDLSHTAKVLVALDIRAADDSPAVAT